jgi:hypothetical protein
MKWFKHDTNSMRKASLERLIMEYGIEGYGLYWACTELIAGDLGVDDINFELKHDAELIAYKFKMDTIKVEKIMHRCIELELFELADSGKIRCLALIRMLDDTMSRNPEIKKIKKRARILLDLDKPPKKPPKKIRKTSSRLDKTRLDKIKYKIPKNSEEVQEYLNTITEKTIYFTGNDYFLNYSAQDWIRASGQPIKSWKNHVRYLINVGWGKNRNKPDAKEEYENLKKR